MRFHRPQLRGWNEVGVRRPWTSSVYGQPTVVDGRVFIGSDFSHLYSLDAETGRVHWSYQAQAGLRSTPMIGAGQARDEPIGGVLRRIRGNAMPWTRPPANSCGKCESIPIRSRASPPAQRSMRGAPPRPGLAGGARVGEFQLHVLHCARHGCGAGCIDRKADSKDLHDSGRTVRAKDRQRSKFPGPSGAGIWGPITIDPKRRPSTSPPAMRSPRLTSAELMR